MSTLISEYLKKIEKDAKLFDAQITFSAFINVISSMLGVEGLPETVRPEFIELYLNLDGIAAIIPNDNGDYIVAKATRGGAPDDYGLGADVITTTLNGRTEVFKADYNGDIIRKGDKVGVVIYNNNTKEPSTLLHLAVNMMTEALTSFYANVIHSRYAPVFSVNSDVIKRSVENSMADIVAGKPCVVVADNIVKEIETGQKAVEILNFTDVDKQEKIQFITKVIDDVLRWFLSFYGQNITGNGKLAQQTVDEVNGGQGASFIIPEMMWRCRQHALDLLNKELGWNARCFYNKPWTVELEKYTEDEEEAEEEGAGLQEEEAEETPDELQEEEKEEEEKDDGEN